MLAVVVILILLIALTTAGYFYLETKEPKERLTSVEGKPDIVLFYADWCGYCKAILPLWDQLSREYPNVRQVDGDKESGLSQKHGVTGFPTIIAMTEPTVKYSGDRSLDSLRAFINSF